MSRFAYYNVNPMHSIEGDCVTRAIMTASGLQYYVVQNLLDLIADHCECEKLNVECYGKLLENILEYRLFYCDHGETVADIADRYPNNIVLIRIDGHLTVSVYGTIVDLWDSAEEYVDRYWIVQR